MTEMIDEACSFLRGRVRETPVERAPLLDRGGGPVWLKLENLQLTGSFKIRGAWFKLAHLTEAERARGVAACSAGNHGKGVAYAARELGIGATIYVPARVDAAKHRGIIDLGATVMRSQHAGYDDTATWARADAKARGLTWIPGFEDDAIMAGNGGSLAVELLAQRPTARRFVVPVGGGGLAGGFVAAVKRAAPDATIIGVQHAECPAFALSIRDGRAHTHMPAIQTVAGGIEGGLGERNFEILRGGLERVVHVDERSIRGATAWLVDEHQLIAEPTAAVALAAALSGAIGADPRETVVVITGRNVAASTLGRLLG